ncbi:MAG TPA: efflux RND transporter periplasmic adaptor subunit [Terriglobales bacterium]|jgi:RND family efflux transporter MFP subunit|nr:efflux RND transporter periplasmic adaptor subunit [Terriglobales bacterium]
MSKRFFVVFFRSVVFAAIGVWIVATAGCAHSSGSTASVSGETVPRAAVVQVRREPLSNTLSIAGEFLPYQEVELHAKVAGYIRNINVDIGDHVHQGQVLAVLEIPELTAQLQSASAGVGHSQEEITHAQNEVSRAEADYQALHTAATRLRQASEARPGLIAEQELDDALAKDRSAEAQVDAAKSELGASRQQLEISRADRQHYAALSEFSRITAPFDGVVTWRYADTGSLIQAGTSNVSSMPVVKLSQVNVLRLRIPVPESLAASVRDGELADIRVKATDEHFSGKIIRSTDSLDRSTRTMQVEVDVPNKDYKLTPGMYADVSLRIQNDPTALTLPVQAINRDIDQTTVFLVNSQNHLEQRKIQTGIESSNRIQILSGLNEGDRVIVGNLGEYRSGEHVDPRMSAMSEEKYTAEKGAQ